MSTRKVYSSSSKYGCQLNSSHKTINTVARPSDAVPHNGVSYEDLKKQCLSKKVLFEDPDFPTEDLSLYFSKKPPRPFVWKRPKVCI